MGKKMKKSVDANVFRRTAVTTKKINLAPTSYRGGIRL